MRIIRLLFIFAVSSVAGLGMAHAQESDADRRDGTDAILAGPTDSDIEDAAEAAQDAEPEEDEVVVEAPPRPTIRLVIATKEAPPFSMRNDDGEWEGMSIELWRHIASELNYECEYHETDIAGMVQGLQDGTYDAAVAAMTVTAERESVFDFSHPFYTTGLGIAIRSGGDDQEWLSVLLGLFSWEFIKPFLALLLVLLAVGAMVWLFERKRNAEQFGGTPVEGIGAGFWWSAVTMTTVGYGDKAPLTIGGRFIGLIWMFASIITISGFTAAIASSLTVSQLDSAIEGPEDLPGTKVGSIPDTTSGNYLTDEHIPFKHYSDINEGLQALHQSKIDAMVYDHPILSYYTSKNRRISEDVRVLGETFERQDYAIGLPAKSPYREDINRILLREIGSAWWNDTIFRYLGI